MSIWTVDIGLAHSQSLQFLYAGCPPQERPKARLIRIGPGHAEVSDARCHYTTAENRSSDAYFPKLRKYSPSQVPSPCPDQAESWPDQMGPQFPDWAPSRRLSLQSGGWGGGDEDSCPQGSPAGSLALVFRAGPMGLGVI